MKIRVKVSKSMSSSSSPLGTIEDRLVRIPQVLREVLGFKIGHFLCLKSAKDTSVVLQIATAYYSDAIKDSECVYTSEDTIGKLETTKIATIEPADNILVGCDPEFFLIDKLSNTNISASHFFAHYGEVGSDCGLAELRPRPGLNEYEVTANLRDLLLRAYTHIENRTLYKNRAMEMVAASSFNKVSAGFHIHFGLSSELLLNQGLSHNLLQRIVDVLDYYVGIPSILPEGAEDYYRRSERYSQYGKAGDFRADHVTLEYRVPGGHLLRHPLLTKGILGLNIVVMKDILSRLKVYSNGYKNMNVLKEYKDLHDLYPNLPDKKEVYDIIKAEDTNKAVPYLETIMNDVEKMIGFKERSRSILDYFGYSMSHIKGNEKFSRDLEINWRLKNERQSEQVEFLQASI